MTGVPKAQTKLRELLTTLFQYRHDLEAAELRGDELIAQTARGLIRTQHKIIRRHCQSMGLPRPADVPEKD